MPAFLRSAVALQGALASILLLNSHAHGQSNLKPGASADERAEASWSGLPYGSSVGVAAPLAAVAAAAISASSLPPAPEPAARGGGDQRDVVPAGASHQAPLSRIGIGANVSPLGIGINATTVLSDYFDARLMGNFFGYTVNHFEVEGFSATANLHLASMAASLDWYPFNSVFRFSPGLMFYNGNQFSMRAKVLGGTSFTLDGENFYSASANAATGATPLTGTGVLGLHTNPLAFTLAAGFGKFVPRSNRHWSFPAEFGVVFMGAPTANVTESGWVCIDKA